MTDLTTLITIAALGVAIGLGKLLLTSTPLQPRLLIGTALVSGGIALGALAVLAVIPGLSFAAQIGLAAAGSVLGVVFLEQATNRIFGIAPPK